jgi:hypothetical protein
MEVSAVIVCDTGGERALPFFFTITIGVPGDSEGVGMFGRGFAGTLNAAVFLLYTVPNSRPFACFTCN